MSIRWLKHAFAVDPPGAAEPTEAQKTVVDRVCAEITRRHLTTPALIFLETFRPFNYLGPQALHFFHPFAASILNGYGYRHFAEFLERRGSVDYFCRRIEAMEAEYEKSKDQSSAGEKTWETRGVTG